MEQLKPVPGYETHYEISDLGRLWSISSGKFIKPVRTGSGYLQFGLCKGGIVKRFNAHKLVVEAFRGTLPAGKEINHINGIRYDNRLENLEICSRAYNMEYQKNILKAGTMNTKKKKNGVHPLAAFLPDYKACREMSERVGCDPTHLLNIREGRRKPSVDLLVRLCDDTGLPARAFVSQEK